MSRGRHVSVHNVVNTLKTQVFLLALLYQPYDARYDSFNEVVEKQRPIQQESKLLTYLMDHYDREVRPVYNASKAVEVRVGITLTQIFDMDEKNQVLTTNVWFDQEWHDELLKWNPQEFGGIEKLQIPCDKLWLPDIVLYNSADDYSKGYFRSLAIVDYTGNVFWAPPTKFRSTCSVNVMYFPFDDQSCQFKLSSWMYDGTKVNVTNRTNNVDLENYVPNGEWELLDTRLISGVSYFPLGPEPYPYVTVSLKIRRKTLYYMYNIVFPCMMMSTLTVLVFCMPPDSGEKIALGVTVILAFSVFMLAIAERMPETSESIPLIGIYLTFVMAMTTVSVIMTVIVLNFFYRGPVLTEIPPWAKKYILGSRKLKKTTFPFSSGYEQHDDWKVKCRQLVEKYGLDRIKTQIVKATSRGETTGANGSVPRGQRHSEVEEDTFIGGVSSNVSSHASRLDITMMDRPETASTRRTLEDDHEDYVRVVSGVIGSNGSNGNVQARSRTGRFQPSCSKLDIIRMDCPGAGAEDDQDDLLRVVRGLLDKENRQQKDDQIRREWRMLAEAVDRWLFWSFLLITTISTMLFLVILPFCHRGKFF